MTNATRSEKELVPTQNQELVEVIMKDMYEAEYEPYIRIWVKDILEQNLSKYLVIDRKVVEDLIEKYKKETKSLEQEHHYATMYGRDNEKNRFISLINRNKDYIQDLQDLFPKEDNGW